MRIKAIDIKSGIRWLIVGIIALYAAIILLFSLPYMQRKLGAWTASALSDVIGSEVEIGKVGIGFLNRLVVDDLKVYDKEGELMLSAARTSVAIDVFRIIEDGDICINTAQFFGARLKIYKDSPKSDYNFHFIVDRLKGNDDGGGGTNFRLNSLIVRHVNVDYDVRYETARNGGLDMNHVKLRNLCVNVAVKAVRDDSLNIAVKRLRFSEKKSGIEVKELNTGVIGNGKSFVVMPTEINTVDSKLAINDVIVDVDSNGIRNASLSISGNINLHDIGVAVPGFKDCYDVVEVGGNVAFRNDRLVISDFNLNGGSEKILMTADGVVDGIKSKDLSFGANITSLQADGTWLSDLAGRLGIEDGVRNRLAGTGLIWAKGNGHGNEKNFVVDVELHTSGAGSVKASVERKGNDVKAEVAATDLDLGIVTGESKLGKMSAEFVAEVAIPLEMKSITGMFDGKIERLIYDGYEYESADISVVGNDGILHGSGLINDKNAIVAIDGEADLGGSDGVMACDLGIRANNVDLNALGLVADHKDERYSVCLKAKLSGHDVDDAVGFVSVDSLTMENGDGERLELERLRIDIDAVESGGKDIALESDFADARIYGKIAYADVADDVMNILGQYIPSLVSGNGKGKNDFDFDIKLRDSDFARFLVGLDYKFVDPVDLWGSVDSQRKGVSLNVSAPCVEINGTRYTDAQLACGDSISGLSVKTSLRRIEDNGSTMFAVNGLALNDDVDLMFSWDNEKVVNDMRGEIAASVSFDKNDNGLGTRIGLKRTGIVINDTVWTVYPAEIDIRGKNIACNNLRIERGNQYIKVNGIVSEIASDSIVADINDIQVGYVLNLINFHSVDFDGKASGRAIVSNIFEKPRLDAFVRLNDFSLEGGRLGTGDVHAFWDDDVNGISIDGAFYDSQNNQYENYLGLMGVLAKSEADNTPLRKTTVKGFVSPADNKINLNIGTENTSADFLNGFLGSVFNDINGSVNGNLMVTGPLNQIDLIGDVSTDIDLTLRATNVRYHINGDTIRFRHNRFNFENITILDKYGNSGVVNGIVGHGNLKNFSYNFDINMDNLLCYDEKEFNADKYYATVFGDGGLRIDGSDGNPLNIYGNITPTKGSVFAYDAASPDATTNSSFIQFRNKRMALPDFASMPDTTDAKDIVIMDDYEYKGDIYINFNLNINPDCEIKLRMDNKEDGYITTYGNSNLNVRYHNKGTFQMWGNYNIERGKYRIYLQDIIYRDLSLQPGSNVEFSGNPFDANIHLICWHILNSVPLSDLTASTAYSLNNKIKVICILDITGKLDNMDFTFDLNLPNVNDETRQLVKSMISTEEEMNTQIVYLLGVGRFYTNELARANGEGNSSQAVNSLLSSTLSGQINQMLTNVIGDDSKWNFGTGLSTGENGWDDLDIEGVLSGQLFDDRLLINGNFGYRDNSLTNSSNFVGDFDVKWRIKENSNTYLKAYNQTNDRYFTKATLNTQGIGISFQRDFETWSDLFRGKKKESEVANEVNDSISSGSKEKNINNNNNKQ